MKAHRTKEMLAIKLIFRIFYLAGIVCLLLAIPVLAATPAEENYERIQKSLVLMDQYNGTEMTSAEYLEVVWPQVYTKISPEDREILTGFTHIWELQ